MRSPAPPATLSIHAREYTNTGVIIHIIADLVHPAMLVAAHT